MLLQKLIKFTKKMEDPRCPLLGPNLKALYMFGLWQTGSGIRNIIYNAFHVSTLFFVLTQIIDLIMSRKDLNKALCNFSLTTLSSVCCAKCLSYVLFQSKWTELVNNISQVEVIELKKRNPRTLVAIENYTKYSRIITYTYWIMVGMTNLGLILAPLIRYLASPSYRMDIADGKEPYPQIINSWFPFNKLKMPGYIYASAIQIVMSIQGAAVIATYDSNAFTIMTFMKGQMVILREKCADIFSCESKHDIYKFLNKIKECHRHHNFLMKQFHLFDYLLSPVMFIYVLLCSITICCSVVQFQSNDVSTSHRLWVVQYTSGQIFQLFLFCWHSNEVLIESQNLDRGVYTSDWWKADVRLRKQLLLLASKLNCRLVIRAGPFSNLSLPTFVNIMKGSYSFFTLFSQIQQ